MPRANNLNTAHAEYVEHPGAEQVSVLFAMLRTYVRRIVQSWSRRLTDPEDVTAQIVASVWASMHKYDGRSAFTTWVHQIARRKVFDALRKSTSTPLTTTDDRLITTAAPVADHPLLEPDSLTGLTDDERNLVQRLIERPDYDALSQSLCITRKALVRRLERINEKCERERGKSVTYAD